MTPLLNRLRSLIDDLYLIDFGYPLPLGDNQVYPASGNAESLGNVLGSHVTIPGLADFYEECDGLSLPDVRNGYFIRRLSRITGSASQPSRVVGHLEASVIVVGSTGGGGLFAVDKDTGKIFLLGPGLIKGGVFYSDASNATLVADDWNGFMARLVADVHAFIAEEVGHHYIA